VDTVEKSPGSRGVRDTETGVPINSLVAGEFLGDGRPKPVRFPDPTTIARVEGSYRVLDVRTLVELKLASGMSAADRLQDLADVVALVAPTICRHRSTIGSTCQFVKSIASCGPRRNVLQAPEA
jgi:hypothetical protein